MRPFNLTSPQLDNRARASNNCSVIWGTPSFSNLIFPGVTKGAKAYMQNFNLEKGIKLVQSLRISELFAIPGNLSELVTLEHT